MSSSLCATLVKDSGQPNEYSNTQRPLQAGSAPCSYPLPTSKVYQKFSQITIDISVPLAESLPASGRLYWLVRGLDIAGSGNAEFRTEDAAKLLGVSRSTISRYVSQGQSKGWFTSVIRQSGGYRLLQGTAQVSHRERHR